MPGKGKKLGLKKRKQPLRLCLMEKIKLIPRLKGKGKKKGFLGK